MKMKYVCGVMLAAALSLLSSVCLCSSSAALHLASITGRQIRNLAVQTIKGCSSALKTTHSCCRVED